MPDTVRAAIETRLKATVGVTSLLSSASAVYYRRAPQGSKPPLIVYDKRSGVRSYALGGDTQPILNQTWLIRGIAFGRTPDRAEEIAAAVAVALTNAPLSASGRVLLAIWPESDVSYPEQIGKELLQHEGHVYRVTSQTSPALL